MLAINTIPDCEPGSHKVPRVYSVSPAVSSIRRPMSDPSGEYGTNRCIPHVPHPAGDSGCNMSVEGVSVPNGHMLETWKDV